MSQPYFVTGALGCIGAWVVKTLVERGDVPVVFVAADPSPMDRTRALELGARDIIPKPFDPRELTMRIRRVFERIALEAGDDLDPIGDGPADADPAQMRDVGVVDEPDAGELAAGMHRFGGDEDRFP